MHRIVVIGCAVVCVTLAAGCTSKTSSTSTTQSPAATTAGPARIAITIDSTGFNPPTVHATAGQPVTLVFTRVTDQTCATSIQIPSLQITKDVPLNTPTEVTLTPSKKGDIGFACGMNMITGVINVQ